MAQNLTDFVVVESEEEADIVVVNSCTVTNSADSSARSYISGLQKKGKKVYVLPSGGSTPLGLWGYINFIEELSKQKNLKSIKGVISAYGSGGTSAGLLLGAALLKSKMKIYAVNVFDDDKFAREKIIELVEDAIVDYNLDVKVNYDNLVVIEGYSKEGYKNIEKKKLKIIKEFYRESGILLDPAYTGKTFYAYYKEFLTSSKKSNILFIHTGGLFGVFSKREKYLEV